MASAAPIGTLRADLVANSAMFAADMARARNAVQNAAAGMQKAMANFQKGANNAVKEIFNFRNAAVVVAGGALVAFIRQQVKAAAEIDDTSQRLGISAESFQELSYAAKIAGVEQEDFIKAMEQFNKRLGDFKGGITGAQTALGQLGLSMADLKGKTPDEAFKIVADRLARIPDPMRRAAIEAELFGKAGAKLDNVLTLGAKGLAHYAAEAHNLGFILSNETIKKAAEADDEFDRIGKSLKVAGINIAAGFLPALTEVRKVFTSQDFQDSVRSTSAALAEFVKWMVDNKNTIIVVSTALAGLKLGAAFGSAFGKQGAVIGSVTGALVGLAAGANMVTEEAERADKQLTKLTVNKASPQIPNPISPEVGKAIDDLIFKARIIKGDFDALAEGFPEAAKGLKVFGTTADENRTSVSQLTPELQRLNEAQLKFKAAQLTQEALPPWQKMNTEIERARMAMQAVGVSAEVTGVILMRIQFPSLTKAIEDATNLRARLEDLSVTSLNNLSSALTGIVMGTEKASVAFKRFALSVVTDLTAMIIKATLFSTIARFLGFSGGGKVGFGGFGFRAGGLVGFPAGGFVSGPGTGTSDSIMARLSDGEFVINAASTRQNLPLLKAINTGDVSSSASGQPVIGGHQTLTVHGLSGTKMVTLDMVRAIAEKMISFQGDGGKILLAKS